MGCSRRHAAYVLILGVFWCAYFADASIAARARRHRASLERPPVVNGLTLSLDRWVSPPVSPEGGKSLILVMSDACPFSRAEVPRWQELLGKLRWSDRSRLVLITTAGAELATSLAQFARSEGIDRVSLHSVTRSGAFAQETGVAWTPETLVADASMKVRLSSESITPAFERAVLEWFGES